MPLLIMHMILLTQQDLNQIQTMVTILCSQMTIMHYQWWIMLSSIPFWNQTFQFLVTSAAIAEIHDPSIIIDIQLVAVTGIE